MQGALNGWVVLQLEGGVIGCKNTKRILRAVRTLSTEKADRQIIGEMISDCDFSQQWQQTGRRPGNMRGIERTAAYQREKLMDPIRMQAFVSQSQAGSPSNLSESDRANIESALSGLSPRERECYELHRGMCYSYGTIANMIGIKKATVQSYVETADRKLQTYSPKKE